MNWADENYVRLFTRETVTTAAWSWETQATFALLLKKVSKAGVLDIGRRAPADAVAVITRMPLEVARVGVEQLLEDGTLEHVGGALIIPNFNAAQETRKSNAQSKREQREKEKDELRLSQILETTQAHRQTPADSDRSGHPPAQLSSAQPSPAQPAAAVAAEQRPPPEKLAVVVTEPTAPPSAWSGADFWRWFQAKRQKAGFTAEKYPRTDPSHWFSQAMSVVEGDVELLKEAVLRFGDDRYWQAKDPPLPWAGFTSQCPPKWIPRKERPRAEG